MAHQYLNDGEEEEVRSRPADEPERREGSHEDVDVPTHEASSHANEQVAASAASRRQRRPTSSEKSEKQTQADDAPVEVASSSRDADLRDLKSRGFTEDEAIRLIDLSVRINEVTLKRLQFTKWLVDQGLLDEFSLRD